VSAREPLFGTRGAAKPRASRAELVPNAVDDIRTTAARPAAFCESSHAGGLMNCMKSMLASTRGRSSMDLAPAAST
jgi:hypothetical protein